MNKLKIEKNEIQFLLDNIPDLTFLDKIILSCFHKASNETLKKLELTLLQLENKYIKKVDSFYESVFSLLNDFSIIYDEKNILKHRMLYVSNVPKINSYNSSRDFVNDAKSFFKKRNLEIKLISNEVVQINNLKTDRTHIDLFKKTNVRAIYFEKAFEIIFLKENVIISSETEFTSYIYCVFNLKKLKLLKTSDSKSLGYCFVIRSDKLRNTCHSFINDFHLRASEEEYQRKGIGRFLESEIVRISKEKGCSEIQGKLSYNNMQIATYKQRLLGFWTNMGYTISNSNILKIL